MTENQRNAKKKTERPSAYRYGSPANSGVYTTIDAGSSSSSGSSGCSSSSSSSSSSDSGSSSSSCD